MKAVKCPICKTVTALSGNPYRPFCSNRCKVLDLGAWAEEKYAVPGEETPGDGRTEEDDSAADKFYH